MFFLLAFDVAFAHDASMAGAICVSGRFSAGRTSSRLRTDCADNRVEHGCDNPIYAFGGVGQLFAGDSHTWKDNCVCRALAAVGPMGPNNRGGGWTPALEPHEHS